ncbi:DNA-3-methyladenine glycosylase I [Marinomonas hwangdonensis]|uniref:DNA-3-methyladenine glycosylase I n=1 Tax=Marinomonas hwangdonensis TaxID=1053647 RepID=A0A3M8Q4F9_9GAMM|nr:DNA-3-methyladenine glycosylase I [Marinomonas hwangdonensis]RNF51005.1 DNA-3-methyladenine glycosylase I [Marinomonas hwangdonensis]
MKYELFQSIYDRAALRHGGPNRLETLLSRPLTVTRLEQHSDDRWLAAFSQKVFQSGINWQVVRNKWDGFETVFFGFDIEKMLLIHDEMWEEKAKDVRIIRNYGKVMTIRENALMISECQASHGSFSRFVAHWPSNDIIGLWAYLKKHGARLGGNTGPYTLRAMGKDTFMLTKDVEGYLRLHEIITTGRDTQSAWKAAQTAFNHWHQESGRSYSEISQCIALSVN